MTIAVVDYGMGNLSSVAKAFEELNADVVVSGRPQDLERAQRIVLPGVGAFGEGMRNLRRLGLVEVLNEQVRGRGKPFLGICLGMQLMARESLEQGRHQGLGWIPAVVQPFERTPSSTKSIHIGWNEVAVGRQAPLFRGLGEGPHFYFVHGYHVVCQDRGIVCATSPYGGSFVSSVQQNNIFGVQFHPEKSQEDGLALLSNFLRWGAGAPQSQPPPLQTNGHGAPKIRLVVTLLLSEGRLVKTVQFKRATSGLRRDVGDPIKAPMVYDAQLADELVYLDIDAHAKNRGIAQLREVVADVSGHIFMPLTAGGGIRSVEDIRELLQVGADKVVINTGALERPELISEAASRFGRQCLVLGIDVRRTKAGRHEVFARGGTRATGLDPVEWAQRAARAGAGEILLTSIDRDGTMEGFDLPVIQAVSQAVDIPVIASGGVGTTEDLVRGVQEGGASAVAAASLFHFRDLSPIKAKASMARAGLAVRR